MPWNKTRSRFFKITGIFILAVAILAIPVINYFIPRLIENKIAGLNNKNLKIKAENIEFNLFRGEIRFTDLMIVNSTPEEIADIKVNEICFYGVSFVDLIRRKIISVRHLNIAGSIVHILPPDTLLNPKITKNNTEFPDINIGQLTILDLTLTSNKPNKTFQEFLLYHSDFTINDISFENKETKNLWKDIKYTISQISIPRLQVKTANELYSGTLYNLIVLNGKRTMLIDSASFVPTLDTKDFFKKVGTQTDCIDIKTGKIICHYDKLRNDSDEIEILVPKVSIANAIALIKRDKNYPRKNDVRPTVQQLLSNSKSRFNLEALYLLNSTIVYSELEEGATNPAFVRLSKSSIRIKNINSIDSTGDLQLLGHCLLYDEGTVNIVFDFPLNSNSYTSSGIIKDIHFKKLNSLLKENIHVSLKGDIDALQWAIKGGEVEAKGLMQFAYRNLDVKFEDKDSKKTTGIDEKLKSIFANLFLNKSNNNENEETTNVALYYKRDKTRFVFNYFVKTLLSGIKTSIGLPPSNKRGNKKLNK